jgi:hypothetical protein
MIDRFFGLKASLTPSEVVTGPMVAMEELSKRVVGKFNRGTLYHVSYSDHLHIVILLLTSLGQLQRFRDEIVRFIEGCGTEQAYRMAGYIPGVDEYLDLRPYTSSVYACFLVLE